MHIIIDCHCSNEILLNDVDAMKRWLFDTVRRLDMHLMELPTVVKFPPPGGLTGFAVVAESHVSVHTYPECGFVFLDIFSCGELDVKKAYKWMRESFEISEPTSYLFKRGIGNDRPIPITPTYEEVIDAGVRV